MSTNKRPWTFLFTTLKRFRHFYLVVFLWFCFVLELVLPFQFILCSCHSHSSFLVFLLCSCFLFSSFSFCFFLFSCFRFFPQERNIFSKRPYRHTSYYIVQFYSTLQFIPFERKFGLVSDSLFPQGKFPFPISSPKELGLGLICLAAKQNKKGFNRPTCDSICGNKPTCRVISDRPNHHVKRTNFYSARPLPFHKYQNASRPIDAL